MFRSLQNKTTPIVPIIYKKFEEKNYNLLLKKNHIKSGLEEENCKNF